MVVLEYKLTLNDDFRIGDTVMITSRTSSGWKAMINSKHEIVFELNNDTSIPLLLDGWILVDVNDRWEKMWVCCKENPFQIGFFKSEQEKIEKVKKNESLYLETLVQIEELEVVQATNPQNPPIKFLFRTQSKSFNTILPTKDGMVNTARLISKAIRNKEKSLSKPTKPMAIPQTQGNQQVQLSRSAPQTSPILSHSLTNHREQVMATQNPNNHTHPPPPQFNNNQANSYNNSSNNYQNYNTPPITTTHTPIPTHAQVPPSNYNSNSNNQPTKVVQIQAPPQAAGRSSPGPGQSQIGGAKWLANIKNIVNPKANSSLNVAHKSKDDSKKAQSVLMPKSASSPDLPINNRNTQGALLSPRLVVPPVKAPVEPKNIAERKMLTRVYWRDGTYHTVPVTPGITAKEVCEFCTKKTKVAIFENLFCLYECLADGPERILDPKTNIHELLCGWGEESENHLVCDLNLGTKNTVKTQLRKTLAVSNSNRVESDSYDSESEFDIEDDFGQLDNLDSEPTEEDESIAMMIQEMIKLKHQLQEEDEMIERLAVEEQEVDMLISRLANL